MFSKPFCGRESEIELLWNAYSELERPSPKAQLVVLLGDAGIGKTRIVQEFYEQLAARKDAAGYWPKRISPDGAYGHINPTLSCNENVRPPFIWLGIACNDRLEGVGGHVERMAPHIEPVRVARERRRHLADLTMKAGRFGISAIPVIGPILATGAELFTEARKFIKVWLGGEREEAAATTTVRQRIEKQGGDQLFGIFADFLDAPAHLLDSEGRLRQVERRAAGQSRIPAILLIDDAQYTACSPALLAFVERLLDTASREGWPLLVVATHWRREWEEGFAQEEPSFARMATQWATTHQPEWRPHIIEVQSASRYVPLIQAALPGLAQDQCDILSELAHGNPRLLEQIIQFARVNRRLFVDLDVNGRLSEAGLEELRTKRLDLHELVAERLATAPVAVQMVASVSAMQGLRFLGGITVEVARMLGEQDADLGLKGIENPHGLAFGARDGVFDFAQGVYREVALAHMPNILPQPHSAREAMMSLIRTRLPDAEWLAGMTPTARYQFHLVAAALLADSESPADAGLRAAQYIELASIEAADRDFVTALAFAEAARETGDGLGNLPDWFNSLKLADISYTLVEMGRPPLARELSEAGWALAMRAGKQDDLATLTGFGQAFTNLDKTDGRGRPEELSDIDAMTRSLQASVDFSNPEFRRQLQFMLDRDQDIREAERIGDRDRAAALRMERLRHYEQIFDRDEESRRFGIASIPKLNDDRIAIAKILLPIANPADFEPGTSEHDAASGRLETVRSMISAINTDAFRHIELDPSQSTRRSSMLAIMHSSRILASLGLIAENRHALDAVLPIVEALVAQGNAPSDLYHVGEIHRARAELALNDGALAEGRDELLRAITYYDRSLALAADPGTSYDRALSYMWIATLAVEMSQDDMLDHVETGTREIAFIPDDGFEPSHVLPVVEHYYRHAGLLMERARHREALPILDRLKRFIEANAAAVTEAELLMGLRNTLVRQLDCILAIDEPALVVEAWREAMLAADRRYAHVGDEADLQQVFAVIQKWDAWVRAMSEKEESELEAVWPDMPDDAAIQLVATPLFIREAGLAIAKLPNISQWLDVCAANIQQLKDDTGE